QVGSPGAGSWYGDFGAYAERDDAARGLDATLPGHGEVHQDHVRSRGLGQRHGLAPARRLAHDDQTRLFLQQRTQTGSQDGVIVRQENSDFSPTAGATRIDHRRVSHSKSPTTL